MTSISRGNPWPVSSYFFVQLCLSTLGADEDGMGLGKSLQDLCEKEEAARGASIIFSLPTASGGASIIHPSQSGIGRSLAGKLRENIRTTVDKLLTSFFCAGRVSRADIYKSRGLRIRFESPRRFFHKEGHSSNARKIKYL